MTDKRNVWALVQVEIETPKFPETTASVATAVQYVLDNNMSGGVFLYDVCPDPEAGAALHTYPKPKPKKPEPEAGEAMPDETGDFIEALSCKHGRVGYCGRCIREAKEGDGWGGPDSKQERKEL